MDARVVESVKHTAIFANGPGVSFSYSPEYFS